MNKYFKRGGSPSIEEIVNAIRDIEVRLDELEEGTSLPCTGREFIAEVRERAKVVEIGSTKLQ